MGFLKIIAMSFRNKYYECCDIKINSDHEFLYKFHGFIIWYKINKCHKFKINNHNFT